MFRQRTPLRIMTVAGVVALMGPMSAVAQDPTPAPAATPSRVPGLAEVALCEMPELGLPAGGSGPTLFASVAGTDAGSGSRLAIVQDDVAGATGSSGCRAPTTDVPDPLGREGNLTMFSVPDPEGDSALDILSTSWTEVELSRQDARRLQRDERIVVAGTRNRVLRPGHYALVRVELAGEPGVGDTINIATDATGDPLRRVPSTVTTPTSPLSGIRDVYTLYTEEAGPRALASDLSTGEYYTSKRGFAAFRDGSLTHFLIPRNGMGTDFRPATFRQGDDGPPDSGGLGAQPGRLETDGEFAWYPDCIEQLLIHKPLVLEDVEVSFSTDWVTFCFSASDADLDDLDDFIDDVGNDEGVAIGEIRFQLRESGQDAEQFRPLAIWLEGDLVYLRFPIGLKAYDYHGLADVEIMPTGEDVLDEILGEAGQAVGRWLNPTHFDATAGRMQGGGPCSSRPI